MISMYEQLEDLLLDAREREFDELVKEASLDTLVQLADRCAQACAVASLRFAVTQEACCAETARYLDNRIGAIIRALTVCDEVPLEKRFAIADLLAEIGK